MDKRMTCGGNGSHWDGCVDVHWDCRIAQLEAELARRDEIIKRLKEDGDRLYVLLSHLVSHDETYEAVYAHHRTLMKELE